MSTIFIAIALVAAALAILTVFVALLVLGGVVAFGRRSAPPEPPAVRDPRSLAPTRMIERAPPPPPPPGLGRRSDPTAAQRVGHTDVPSYESDDAGGGVSTEMFGTNAGNYAGLGIDDVDERR